MTSQVSVESRSRTWAAASSSRRTEWATEPGRCGSTRRARISGPGSTSRSGASGPAKPGNVAEVWVSAVSSTSTHAFPAGFVPGANSVRRSEATRSWRTRSSARSAYRLNQKRFSAARCDIDISGSMTSMVSLGCNQKPVRRSGSWASTQVSFVQAPFWLLMTPWSGWRATRVRPPGMTA